MSDFLYYLAAWAARAGRKTQKNHRKFSLHSGNADPATTPAYLQTGYDKRTNRTSSVQSTVATSFFYQVNQTLTERTGFAQDQRLEKAPDQDHGLRKGGMVGHVSDMAIQRLLRRQLHYGNVNECPLRKACVQLTVKDMLKAKGLLKNCCSTLCQRCFADREPWSLVGQIRSWKSTTNISTIGLFQSYLWMKRWIGLILFHLFMTFVNSKLLSTSYDKIITLMWGMNSSLINYLLVACHEPEGTYNRRKAAQA